MIYLDYSATTPCDERVLDAFLKSARAYFANPNSNHSLGLEARALYFDHAKAIAGLMKMPDCEVVFTSGATEANNLAIRGITPPTSAHAITTLYEHPSVTACFERLQKSGVEVEFAKTDEEGLIDPESLEKQIRDNTYLVSVGAVNSEIGITQDLDPIRKVISRHRGVLFHADMTQAIGKIPLPKVMPDLVTISAHKIYGLKGTGALVKPKDLKLGSLLAGGHSLSPARPGTPDLAQTAMLHKAIEISLSDQSKNYEYVYSLNKYLRDRLARILSVHINTPLGSLPHILNISLPPLNSSLIRNRLTEAGIYVSTRTACSDDAPYSPAVYRLTNDPELASSAIRISLSHLTTTEEIEILLDAIRKLVLS